MLAIERLHRALRIDPENVADYFPSAICDELRFAAVCGREQGYVQISIGIVDHIQIRGAF